MNVLAMHNENAREAAALDADLDEVAVSFLEGLEDQFSAFVANA